MSVVVNQFNATTETAVFVADCFDLFVLPVDYECIELYKPMFLTCDALTCVSTSYGVTVNEWLVLK